MRVEEMGYPIGHANFSDIIRSGDTFVDKTLFIKELLHASEKVTLITRPRRFGKTLNLSMIQHFFAEEMYGQKTAGLFDGLKIDQVGGDYVQRYQGQFPVIFITLKDVKALQFNQAHALVYEQIKKSFKQHLYLLDSEHLLAYEKVAFQKVLEGERDTDGLNSSLYDLSEYLYKHHRKRAWILIDEYDSPMHEAYAGGYWEEMSALMKSLMGTTLKDNPFLERGVITGILRIAKENMFSDLNHIKPYTILDNRYSQYFGFTETEVDALIRTAENPISAENVKAWYNGYHFGSSVVYNPWSIMNCLDGGGILKPYWINTSSNSMIAPLIKTLPLSALKQLYQLAKGESTNGQITEALSLLQIETNESAFWTLMVMAGYINAELIPQDEQEAEELPAKLSLPNKEVRIFFRSMIQRWLSARSGNPTRHNLFLDLLNGETCKFSQKLEWMLNALVGQHDVTHQTQEAFYHGFMLGTASLLSDKDYLVESNQESGRGRFDIAIIPKDLSKPGAVIELKAVKNPERMAEAAQHAHDQIKSLAYTTDLQKRGVKEIIQIGIGFHRKDFAIYPEPEDEWS